MKLAPTKPLSSFYSFTLLLLIFIFGCNQNTPMKLMSENPTPVFGGSLNKDQVMDFEQNFTWFYKAGGVNSAIDTPDLMMYVGVDFLARIDTSNWTETGDTGIVFYYAIAMGHDGRNYFTYLVTNAWYDRVNDSIIPIGLFDNGSHLYASNKYLRLNENQSPATSEIIGRQNYVLDYVNGVYLNQITDTIVKIDTLPYHPHSCFYNYNSLYHFYNDNRSALNAGSEKKIVIRHGAINTGLLPNGTGVSNCKVQTPVLIFEVDKTLLLGTQAYFDTPFKNHAMDVGNYCPPGHCSCN